MTSKPVIIFLLAAAFALLSLLLPSQVGAEPATVIPGGLIDDDTTWTAANSPYTIEDTVTITNGATLTVEPGVVVQFNSFGDRLIVNTGSTLSATGTEANPIAFTGTSQQGTSNWDSLVVNAGASATLQHCEISHGGWPFGGSQGALHILSSAVTVSDCVIRDGGDEGIFITGEGLTPSFSNVEIRNNSGDAIEQSTFNMQPTYTNLTLSGNGVDAILSDGGMVTIDEQRLVDVGAPYIIQDTVVVTGGATLALDPGVVWQFNSFGDQLLVKAGGTLDAQGTAGNPITFTGTNQQGTSNWDSLIVGVGATATLRHCEISHGGWPNGGGEGALHVLSSDVLVADCVIHTGGDEGIFITGEGLTPSFSNVEIRDNSGDAIEQSTFDMQPAYANLTATGNGNEVILLPGGTLQQPSRTFVDAGLPYRVTSNVTIPGGSALTLAPGVTWYFDSFGDQLVVHDGGTLTVVGTESEPILISSQTGEPRNWQRVYFAPGSSGDLQYCEVSNGGWWATANDQQVDGLLYILSSDVSVRNCHIHRSDRVGIRVDGAQPTIKDNVIADNEIGLANKTPETEVDATFNYWGDPSGPYHPDLNPAGLGNEVSDGVTFNPWYSSDLFGKADLAVTAVEAPVAASVNDTVTVRYTVDNLSNFALTRDWVDAIYLSADASFSIDDLLLARTTHTGGLGAGDTYMEEVTAPLPGVITGDYYLIVRADSRRTIPDDNFANNERAADEQLAITVPPLTFNAPATGNLAAEESAYYRIDVPAGQDALFTAAFAGEWQGELYLRYGQVPTRSEYDFAAQSFQKASQRLLLKNPPGGSWYVLLYGGPNAGNGESYSLLAEDAPFLLFNASPEQGGDQGQITMNVQGAGFDAATDVLLRNGATTIPAGQVTFVDPYNLVADFDLTGRPLGVYDVEAGNGTGSATLADAFTLVEGVGGQLSASLALPGGARPNRPFRAAVVYENVGDANLPIPMLRVEAPEGAGIYPESYEQSAATTSLQFLAMPDDYFSNGVIAPGQSGRFEFWAVIGPEGSTVYTLSERTTTDAALLTFAGLKAQIRPESVPDLWEDAWSRVTAEIGDETYGALVAALVAAADEAHGYGIELQTMRELIGYMLERAYHELPADVRGTVMVNRGGLLEPAQLRFIFLQDADSDNAASTGAGATIWYDGSFAIRDVTAGSYEVEITGLSNPSPGRLVYSGAPLTGFDVVVEPAAAIHGTVRGAAGWYDYAPFAVIEVADRRGELLTVAEADRWGRYEMTGLPAGVPLYVTAFSPEHPPSKPLLVVPTIGQRRLVDIAVPAGGRVTGVVADAGGSPVADAVVTATRHDGGHVRTAATNALGQYTLAGLYPNLYDIAATSLMHAPAYARDVAVSVDSAPVVDLTLAAAGSVALTVRDSLTSAPLADVQVRALVDGFTTTVTTGANGKALFSGLPLGSVALSFTADGYLYTTLDVVVESATTNGYTAFMSQAGTVSGRFSRDTGMPVSGVRVLLQDDNGFATGDATDADGNFNFSNVPDGNYHLRLGSLGLGGNIEREVTIAGGAAANVDLSLAAAELAGTVLAADGVTPLANGRVTLIQNGEAVATAIADANGRYRFLVFEGGSYDLLAMVDGLGMARLTNVHVTPGSDQSDLDIVMAGAPFSLTPQLNGTPVTDGVVLVRHANDAEELAYRLPIVGGSATLPHLQDGSYEVQINTELAASELFVHTQAGATNLTRPLAPGESVTGIVTTGGQGIAAALVTFVHQSSDLVRSDLTAEDGTYTLAGMPAGSYDVWVSSTNNSFRAELVTGFSVSGGANTLDVPVAQTGTAVSGRISNHSNAGVAFAQVELLDAHGVAVATTLSDPDGSYEIANAPSGSFTLRVHGYGRSPMDTAVTISPGPTFLQDVNVDATMAMRVPMSTGGARAPLMAASSSEGVVAAMSAQPQAATSVTGLTQPTQSPVHSNFYDHLGSLPLEDEACETSEVNSAIADYFNAKRMADLQFSTLNTTFEYAEDVGVADLGLVASQAGLITAKGTALTALLTNDFYPSGKQKAFLTLAPLVADITAGYRNGDFDQLGLALDSLDSLLTTANHVGSAGDDFAAGAGPTMLAISMLRDLKDMINNRDRALDTQVKARLQYEAGVDGYNESLLALQKARNELDAAVKTACTSGGGGGTPPPEEPDKPEDTEEETIEQDETERRVSKDPNDIVGPSGSGVKRLVGQDTLFGYTILYENVPTATAPAQVVLIEHQVDPDLDYGTFAFGDFGFGDLYFPVPAGRQFFQARLDLVSEMGVYVEYTARFNPVTGLATWEFRALDPETGDLSSDPEVGFLPPNDDPPQGEGFVFFTLSAEEGTPDGTTITAQAEIIFDDNEPIVTPTWSNQIGEQIGILLPAVMR